MAVTVTRFKCDRCGAEADGRSGMGPMVPKDWVMMTAASMEIVATPFALCTTCFSLFQTMMKGGSEKYEFKKAPTAPSQDPPPPPPAA